MMFLFMSLTKPLCMNVSLPLLYSEYENSYSFSSPTDDWPSMSSLEMEETNKAVRSHMRRGPLKAIRSVAGRFKDIIVQ